MTTSSDRRAKAPGWSDRDLSPTQQDRIRQVVVTVSYVVCLVGSLIGVGVFGGERIQDAAGGALSAEATLIAPASSAFSIWSVIYTGLGAYVILQWLPQWAADPRQRAIGYLVAISMLLNAAWILTVQADLLWLGVVVIVALLAVLCVIIVRLHRSAPANLVETVVVDGTLGVYLGWVTVATAADIAATLADGGFDGGPLDAEVWAVIVLAAVAAIAIALVLRLGGRLAPAAAIVWGVSWIAVARSSGEPESETTAITAAVVAVLVAAVTIAVKLRRRSAGAGATATGARDQQRVS